MEPASEPVSIRRRKTRRPIAVNDRTNTELLELWHTETDFNVRERLVELMREKGLFPSPAEEAWESSSGSYPDLYDDPNFIKKLLERREFAECYQAKVDPDAEGGDPCVPSEDGFQLSSVQRFVANFISPQTPYKSALLYHGVGVGKTCSAVQIAEQWLHFYPKRQVIILAPPTIQSGFKRNIFDIDKVVLGTGNEPNNADQCTGNIYLEMTNTLYERDLKKIENKVKRAINRRYDIQGYGEFANVIKRLLGEIPDDLSSEERLEEERRILEEHFNGKLLIVDEAHNLRDLAKNVMDDEPDAPGAEQKNSEAEGKRLTQWLRKLLQAVDGLKLVLMTATPMYDSYREIIFLINLILLNEKRPQLIESDVFNPNGDMTEGGKVLLGGYCRRYISYMRGENPDTFPLRLQPDNTLTEYPRRDPRGAKIKDSSFIEHLPIVPIPCGGASLIAQRELLGELPPGAGGISATIMGRIIQAGTCIVPEYEGTDENDPPITDIMARSSAEALKIHFNKQTIGGEVTYRAKQEDGAMWLANSKGYLPEYAPKLAYLLRNIKKCRGVGFVYSRFVSMGAIPLALALEANGYTPYGRRPMLADGIQSAGGRQCSRCTSREESHNDEDHEFSPARYVLLTGDVTLSSGKNKDLIDAARSEKNIRGELIKIVVGSEVASEGVDLRFIREIHILEGWYHLSKTEQVIGRGIRTFSHCLLPPEERNCTVYLYALVMPTEDKRETADLYTYRMAWAKARQVGKVTRLIKENAVDCNLNHDAIIINNRLPRTIKDSRGEVIEDVDINDKPYTAICDWMNKCEYNCLPTVKVDVQHSTEVSYDEFTARWLNSEMRRTLRNIFSVNPTVNAEELNTLLAAYPAIARISLLRAVVGNKSFVVMNNGREGYIVYRNGLYLFQPFIYRDLRIPRAVRLASFPVKRDSYSPALISLIAPVIETNGKVAAADEKEKDTIIAAVDETTIKKVYNSWRKWAKGLSTGDMSVPDNIRTWLDGQVGRDSKILMRRLDRLNAVRWFASACRRGRIDAELLESILLEFMFDEEMTAAEQFTFYAGAADLYEIGAAISPEQFKRVGKNSVFINVAINSGELKFICGADGGACKTSIVDLIKEEDIFNYKIYGGNTGELYGFLIPKNGVSLVFKTAKPAATKTGKIDKGQECANVSNASDHRKKLVRLGTILSAARMHNLNLTEALLTDEPEDADKLKNVAQLCTLMDLVLRFMDKKKVLGKRWFYRTVEANIFGHKMPGRKGGSMSDDE